MLIPVIIDLGASANVLDSATFHKLMDNGFILQNSNVKIYPYRSEMQLPVKGMFSAMCQHLAFTHVPILWLLRISMQDLFWARKRRQTLVYCGLDLNVRVRLTRSQWVLLKRLWTNIMQISWCWQTERLLIKDTC